MGNRNRFLFKTTNEEEHNDEYCKTSELVARYHNDDLPGIINDRPFIQLLVGKKAQGKVFYVANIITNFISFLF